MFKTSELLSNERCSDAIPIFLATTDGGGKDSTPEGSREINSHSGSMTGKEASE